MTHNEGQFRDHAAQNQFEWEQDGAVAFVEYFSEADKIYLTHTEVPPSHRNQGMAAKLIAHTLEHLRKQHRVVVPQCSYVMHYINQHPQWQTLLPEGYQM